MARWKPFVRKDSYMPNNKMTPLVIGNGYTTDWGANGQPPVWDTAIGNPVSFNALTPFPLKQLQIAFSPVQDLHGYDAPWPAGGGKNLFGGGYNTIFPLHFDADTDIAVSANLITGSVVPQIEYLDENQQRIDYWGLTSAYSSISGRVARNFTLPKETYYVRFIGAQTTEYQIELGNANTAFAPYSNECPISGWDGVTVEQTGVNVWDEEWINGRWAGNNGVLNAAFPYLASKNKISVAPNTTYYFCIDFSGSSAREIVYYDANKNWISDSQSYYTNNTFTTPSNCHYITFNLGGGYGTTYNNDISINYPSTDHDYHAYNPLSRSISISFGSTVYSGTLDVLTGVVTVDMAYRLLNDASKWRSSAGTTDFFYNEDFADRKLFPSSYTGIICSYVQIREQSGVAYGRWQSATNYRFGIKENGTGLTIDDVKDASTAGKIAICYELATPIPIQLTPQEVKSLAGDNTMWTDGDSLTVEYRSN